MMKLKTFVAVLSLLGVASNASAVILTGGPNYALPGGGSCTVTMGTFTTVGGGATVTCSGISLASHSKVYIGLRVDQSPNGNTMTGADPAAAGAEVFRFSSSGVSNITYTSTTPANSFWTGPPGALGAMGTATSTLTLTRTVGSATVVAAGGNPANSPANGDVGALFQVTSAGITFDVDITANRSPLAVAQASTVYDNLHATAGGGGERSRVDMAFYWSDCGDGVVDSPVEQCDLAGANGSPTSCCTGTCQFRAGGETCRAALNECDVTETCTGSSATCPGDVVDPGGTPCTDDGNVCTNDQCNGTIGAPACLHPNNSAPCTDGAFCNGTDTCSGGTCSIHTGDPCDGPDGDLDCSETCDEGADDCNGNDPDGGLCRADTGECDVAETCLGGVCPADAFEPNGEPCGSPTDTDCDNPDTCNGSNVCLPNLEPPLAPCGDPSDTDCTNPDTCDGAGTCEGNHEPNSVVCRAASAGQECDAVENCDGAGSCPADGVLPLNTPCRAVAGVCDVAEVCDGVGSDCPADVFEPTSTECRADGGECDVAENCTSSGPDCPSDGFEPSGTGCGSSADTDCDNPDTCDGNNACDINNEPSGTTCTSDGETCTADECDGLGLCQHPAGNLGTECRAASAGQECDEPEECDGVNSTCPADGVKPINTVCRPDAGACDLEEVCDGMGSDCPANVFVPDTTSCSDGQFCNGAETCQTGICTPGTDPCPEFCEESTDMCAASSCASTPLSMCRTAQKSLLLIKNKEPDNAKDRLVWKWIKGLATSQMDFADPTTTAHYGLCIYAGTASGLVGTMDVPPSSNWTPISDKGYKYLDLNSSQDGAFKIKLKGSTQPKSKALVKGRGIQLTDPLSATPLPLPVTVQLVNNQTGICFQSVFMTPKLNTEAKFKAKTP